MADVGDNHLRLPRLLVHLVTTGRWEQAAAEPWAESPRVDRLRAVLPDENDLHLLLPPFRTVRDDMDVRGPGEPFYEEFGALDQIEPELAVLFAEFELGSDSALILDYQESLTEPPVRYLQWSTDGPQHNCWVTVAPDFASFAEAIEL